MDDALRSSLWNVLHIDIWDVPGFMYGIHGGNGRIYGFAKEFWFSVLKLPIGSIPPHPNQILGAIQQRFYGGEWYTVYDFLEALFEMHEDPELIDHINLVLKHEKAGYRVVNGKFVDLTNEEEITEIEQALASDQFAPVATHIQRALELQSDRKNPDYRNSIKESISALESMAKAVTGNDKAVLGDALKVLEKRKALHPALREGLSRIYGYTSDADGIRHALLEESEISAADARLFLILCSAFINYIKASADFSL